MCPLVFRARLPALCIELKSVQRRLAVLSGHFTYVCVEDLHLTQKWMFNDDAGRGLAHEPISSGDIDRRAVERVWMYGCPNKGIFREESEACSECTTERTYR
jgi:hypothetical protein